MYISHYQVEFESGLVIDILKIGNMAFLFSSLFLHHDLEKKFQFSSQEFKIFL